MTNGRNVSGYGKEYEQRLAQAVRELKGLMHGEGWTEAESCNFLYGTGEI